MIKSNSERLLELIPSSLSQSGYSQSQWLAMKLQIKKGSVSKALQRLEAKGLIKGMGKTTNRYYEIVQSCPKPVQSPKSMLSEVSHSKPSIQAKRMYLHKLTRSYPLTKQHMLDQAKQVRLNNNIQQLGTHKGISYRLTTKHLIIEGIRLYGELATPAHELQAQAEWRADAVATELQAHEGFKTEKNAVGGELGTTSIVEIAITEHAGAQGLAERIKGKIVLYEDPITHKLVWADRTPLPAAIESNDANLILPWQRFTKGLEENRWSIKDQLELNQQFIKIMGEQARVYEGYKREIETHMKLMHKIDKKLSQRTLKEWL